MRSRLALYVALCLTAGVFIGSLLPRVPMPDGPFGDKLMHLAGYAALGAAWRAALRGPTGRLLAAVFAFGVAIECLQGLSPWRSFEWADMLANGLGASAGIVLVALLSRLR